MTSPQTSESVVKLPKIELITVAELDRLIRCLRCPYDTDIHYDHRGSWVIKFAIEGRQYALATVRGTIRRWRQLDPVLAFLQAHCCSSREVRLHAGSWTLSRDSQHDETPYVPSTRSEPQSNAAEEGARR
jgi:hypothetical protein